MKKSKLSRRITWHVAQILTIINVLIIVSECYACLGYQRYLSSKEYVETEGEIDFTKGMRLDQIDY